MSTFSHLHYYNLGSQYDGWQEDVANLLKEFDDTEALNRQVPAGILPRGQGGITAMRNRFKQLGYVCLVPENLQGMMRRIVQPIRTPQVQWPAVPGISVPNPRGINPQVNEREYGEGYWPELDIDDMRGIFGDKEAPEEWDDQDEPWWDYDEERPNHREERGWDGEGRLPINVQPVYGGDGPLVEGADGNTAGNGTSYPVGSAMTKDVVVSVVIDYYGMYVTSFARWLENIKRKAGRLYGIPQKDFDAMLEEAHKNDAPAIILCPELIETIMPLLMKGIRSRALRKEVTLDRNYPKFALRLILLHELGHHMYRRPTLNTSEAMANWFAYGFLNSTERTLMYLLSRLQSSEYRMYLGFLSLVPGINTSDWISLFLPIRWRESILANIEKFQLPNSPPYDIFNLESIELLNRFNYRSRRGSRIELTAHRYLLKLICELNWIALYNIRDLNEAINSFRHTINYVSKQFEQNWLDQVFRQKVK